MNAETPWAASAGHPDRLALVTRHRSYRGMRVEQDLISQFTMYCVELDSFGLFISDSQRTAFDMAFEALAGRTLRPQASCDQSAY